MVAFNNTAEGGVAAATVSTTNSGGASGNAWNNIVIETSQSLTYESAAAYRGNLGYWARSTATGHVNVGYRTGSNRPFLRFRAYCYVRQYLGIQFIQFLGTGGTGAGIFGYVQMDSSGHLFVIDSGGTNHTTKSQPAVGLNQWFRLEVICVPSTTATSADGRMFFQCFLGEDTTPYITYDAATANTALNLTGWNFGKVNTSGIWTNGFYFDEVASDDLSSTDFIGPVDPPESDPTVRATVAAEANGTDWQAIAIPPGTVLGDWLLAFHVGDDAAPTTIDNDAGVLVATTVLDSGNSDPSAIVQTKTHLRKYDGTEPNPMTFHWAAFVDTAAGIMTIKGADPASPIRAQAVATGVGTSMVAPSVAGGKTGDLLVCVWYVRTDGTARGATVPGSMREKADVLGTWASFVVATEKLTADGASGTRTATFPISASYRAVSLLVRPVNPALDDLRLGSGTVLLRLGSLPVDAVYLGAVKVWP